MGKSGKERERERERERDRQMEQREKGGGGRGRGRKERERGKRECDVGTEKERRKLGKDRNEQGMKGGRDRIWTKRKEGERGREER